MQLTVLGCSGTFPGPDSPCSSYVVESDGFRLLIDAGSGALSPLQRYGGLLQPDAAVISHLHGDHYLDLVPYVYARAYSPDGPPPALGVYATSGLTARLTDLVGGQAALVHSAYDVRQLQAGALQVGPFALTLARMAHPVECYGLRIEAEGRSLAYSADTGPTDVLVDLARDADVLLAEAGFGAVEGPPDLHLTGRQAGQHAAAAGVGRLLLTHLVPWNDAAATREQAATAYAGPVDAVGSGDRYEI